MSLTAGRTAGPPTEMPPGPGSVPTAASRVEATIARLLTLGTRLAIGLLAIGSVLLVLAGISPLAEDWPPFDPASLVADLVALRPEGFLWLGLLATIATPLARVAVSTTAFARAGERRMVLLGIAVLVVIALAVVAGLRAG
jgi:uncharacterized membrane protein